MQVGYQVQTRQWSTGFGYVESWLAVDAARDARIEPRPDVAEVGREVVRPIRVVDRRPR